MVRRFLRDALYFKAFKVENKTNLLIHRHHIIRTFFCSWFAANHTYNMILGILRTAGYQYMLLKREKNIITA